MVYKLLGLAILAFLIGFVSCVENKRKPDKIIKNSRQLAMIYGDSLANRKLNILTTVYIKDSLNDSVRIDITRDMMSNIIELLRKAIDFNYTKRMDEILRYDNIEAAELALIKEMDKIARESGFENFSQASKIIDKLKDYPEISVKLNKLSEIEKIKYR
jgi:hypothetical protein